MDRVIPKQITLNKPFNSSSKASSFKQMDFILLKTCNDFRDGIICTGRTSSFSIPFKQMDSHTNALAYKHKDLSRDFGGGGVVGVDGRIKTRHLFLFKNKLCFIYVGHKTYFIIKIFLLPSF